MPLSTRLAAELMKRFPKPSPSASVASAEPGGWFCPGCGADLKDMACTGCKVDLRDLLHTLVELHPHR